MTARENFKTDLVLVSLTAILVCAWWSSKGTGDALLYVATMSVFQKAGLISGFRLTHLDVQYPPLSSVLLYLGAIFRLDNLKVFKAILLASQALSCWLIWQQTASRRQVVLFALATVVSTMGLGYLDILMAAPILAAIQSCKRGSYGWSTFWFMIALFMKWQPLVLLPGIAAFAVLTTAPARIKWGIVFLSAGIAVCLAGALLLVFGTPFIDTLSSATGQHRWLLSGDGASPQYLFAEVLARRAGHPGDPVTSAMYPHLWPWVNYPFDMAAVIAFAAFIPARKNLDNLILFSVMLFWIYYLLAAGVHENHLALAVFLCFALPPSVRAYREITFLTALAFNTNMVGFFFLCLLASPPRFPLWLTLDIRTFVAVLNTALGIAAVSLCYRLLRNAWTLDYEGVLVDASE